MFSASLAIIWLRGSPQCERVESVVLHVYSQYMAAVSGVQQGTYLSTSLACLQKRELDSIYLV